MKAIGRNEDQNIIERRLDGALNKNAEVENSQCLILLHRKNGGKKEGFHEMKQNNEQLPSPSASASSESQLCYYAFTSSSFSLLSYFAGSTQNDGEVSSQNFARSSKKCLH